MCTFFCWNFVWFGQKGIIKVQNFRLSTVHAEFHQICTFIGSFCWKYIKFQLRKYRGVMSHDIKERCKIWRKTDFSFHKWWILNLVNFGLSTWNFQNFYFDWFLLCKVYNVWAKKVQRSYVSWHWKAMQILKKSWLVVWKMTWVIWQIFTSVLKSLKIGSLMGPFIQSRKCMSLKLPENLCVMAMKDDAKFQENWLVVSKLTWGI